MSIYREKIKEIRLALEKSEAEFAGLLGIAITTYTKIENGQYELLSLDAIKFPLFNKLKVSKRWFFDDKGKMFKASKHLYEAPVDVISPPHKYDTKRFEASVLYIKHGLTAIEIGKQINISLPTLKKWKEAGQWDALRPNLEILNEYKAAGMYINKGMSVVEIAMKLGVSATFIEMWISLNGWDAAKQLHQAQGDYTEVITAFCQHFAKLLPRQAIDMEFVKNDYLKNILSKQL